MDRAKSDAYHPLMAAICCAICCALLSSCAATNHPEPHLRTTGVIRATIGADGSTAIHVDGCAEFALDGRTCLRLLETNSVVRVASISKLFVAFGVMRLVEAHKIDLDRDVSNYLSFSFRNPHYPNAPITLRALLSHTSSVLDGDGYILPLGANLEKESKNPSHWSSGGPPGRFFTYSNFGFIVIGTVVEAVTGERFDLLMKRLVLDPLGIEACFNWSACPPGFVERAATLYRTGIDETDWHPDGPWVAQVDDLKGRLPDCPVRRASESDKCDVAAYKPGTNGSLFSPQGGLRISAAGLARIGRVFLNRGTIDGKPFLSQASISEMLHPQWIFTAAQNNGETQRGSICAYGLSVHLIGLVREQGCRDDLFGDGRARGGHLGEAYGLLGGLWLDMAAGRGNLYLVTGTSDDPHRLQARTGFSRLEEMLARQEH